jgi:hypothetical protein
MTAEKENHTMSEFKKPVMLHLYNEGEFVRSKEARTKKEYDQMIKNGYIEETASTEYPKMLYRSLAGNMKERIVQSKEEEAEAKKAGFDSLHKAGANQAETAGAGKGSDKTVKK